MDRLWSARRCKSQPCLILYSTLLSVVVHALTALKKLIGNSCGRVFDWDNVHPVHGDQCGKTKAVIAFSFLSALLWLVSALVGFFWVRRRERTVARAEAAHHNRRRGPWFRSRV